MRHQADHGLKRELIPEAQDRVNCPNICKKTPQSQLVTRTTPPPHKKEPAYLQRGVFIILFRETKRERKKRVRNIYMLLKPAAKPARSCNLNPPTRHPRELSEPPAMPRAVKGLFFPHPPKLPQTPPSVSKIHSANIVWTQVFSSNGAYPPSPSPPFSPGRTLLTAAATRLSKP